MVGLIRWNNRSFLQDLWVRCKHGVLSASWWQRKVRFSGDDTTHAWLESYHVQWTSRSPSKTVGSWQQLLNPLDKTPQPPNLYSHSSCRKENEGYRITGLGRILKSLIKPCWCIWRRLEPAGACCNDKCEAQVFCRDFVACLVHGFGGPFVIWLLVASLRFVGSWWYGLAWQGGPNHKILALSCPPAVSSFRLCHTFSFLCAESYMILFSWTLWAYDSICSGAWFLLGSGLRICRVSATTIVGLMDHINL